MGLAEVAGEVIHRDAEGLRGPVSDRACVFYRYRVQEYWSSGKNSRWVTVKEETATQRFYLRDETGQVLVDATGANVEIPIDTEVEPKTAGTKRIRFQEYLLEPGDHLYILGTAGDNPEVAEAVGTQNVEDIMIQRGTRKNCYFISDSSERALLSALKWKMCGGVYGGALLTLACLAFILYKLHLL